MDPNTALYFFIVGGAAYFGGGLGAFGAGKLGLKHAGWKFAGGVVGGGAAAWGAHALLTRTDAVDAPG